MTECQRAGCPAEATHRLYLLSPMGTAEKKPSVYCRVCVMQLSGNLIPVYSGGEQPTHRIEPLPLSNGGAA